MTEPFASPGEALTQQPGNAEPDVGAAREDAEPSEPDAKAAASKDQRRRWRLRSGVRAARPDRPAPSAAMAIYGAALSIVAALFLGFAADLTFIGALHHNRDQRIAYSALRGQLALGTAPVGPVANDGKLLAAGAPVAFMRIPAIGLSEVVFEGTTSRVLASGAGHGRLTPMPGQAGTAWVMGRRAAFGGPFRDIGRLHAGDRITVKTGQGTSEFVVRGVRRAGDLQPQPLAVGKGRLQLITASGPAFRPDGVVRVDADLTSPVFGTPVVGSGIPALATAEKPLQGDTSVLMVLVLWGQALLLGAALVAWARVRWGVWQTWIVGLPLLTALGLAVADRVAQLLPNLM